MIKNKNIRLTPGECTRNAFSFFYCLLWYIFIKIANNKNNLQKNLLSNPFEMYCGQTFYKNNNIFDKKSLFFFRIRVIIHLVQKIMGFCIGIANNV